jgi:superfamily I DNA and/or RNA helicase
MVSGEVPDRLETGAFNVDRDDPQATFDRGDRALTRFADAPERSDLGRLREVFFGDAPVTHTDPGPLAIDRGLNDDQAAAVRLALGAAPVALVHGPPGTGKTHTLVEVIRLAAARGERVLACAMSNVATDHLARQLHHAGLEIIRLGHPVRVASDLSERTLERLLEETYAGRLARAWMAEARSIRERALTRRSRGGSRRSYHLDMKEVRALFRDARQQLAGQQAALLEGASVICATAAGSDVGVLGDMVFDRVVLDEATQAPDPVALVALARAPLAVLAGDPEQLPPTIIDVEAARDGLGTTIFERLAARDEAAVHLLTVQYRMHDALARFPSRTRYGDRLVSDPSVAQHRLADLPGVDADPLRPGPLVLVDTAGKGWDDEQAAESASTRNPGQADRTVAEVRRLLSRGVAPRQVAVITPYRAQLNLLRAALESERQRGLEIGTVDGFQGREKEAVIVDLVRSNADGAVGFVADRRRLNVALTRARRFLLVVADSATLCGEPDFAAFAEEVETQGGWVSAWNDDAEPI